MDRLEYSLNAIKQYNPDALLRLYHGARDMSAQAKAVCEKIESSDCKKDLDRFSMYSKSHAIDADCYLRAYAVMMGVKPIGAEHQSSYNFGIRFLFTDDDYMWIRLKWA